MAETWKRAKATLRSSADFSRHGRAAPICLKTATLEMFTVLSPPQPTFHNDFQGARHHPTAQQDVDDMDYEIDVEDLGEGSSAVTSPGQVITSSQAFMRY